jgi:hypothetical protein
MFGATPKFRTHDRARRVMSPGAICHGRRPAPQRHAPSPRWRSFALLAVLVPLSFTLAQCGKTPSGGTLAANAPNTTGDSFEDRFSAVRDRVTLTTDNSAPRQSANSPRNSAPQTEPAPYKLASLAPTLPDMRPARADQTTLVSLKSSAFPYLGNNPRNDEPFLDVSKGERRGHRSYNGHVYWLDETYNDNRVLMHVPEHFDIRKPGVIVVFFHGNGATLARDVRDRQLVPRQISESGVNAVLLAPQLAVDAADSSAGKFWQPDGFKRFMAESATHLARLSGNPDAAKAFANMPIVIVGYSGGFLPTAWSLEVGGLGNRVRGVVLLDAVYGELDKFASWIANNRRGFFVSAYTRYTKRHDHELMQMLKEKSIAISEDIDGPLRPGSVVFVETPEGVTHRDYVTHAWAKNPIKQVLIKMAATPALTRVAASASPAASR